MENLQTQILNYCQNIYPESIKCAELANEFKFSNNPKLKGITKTMIIAAAEKLQKEGKLKLYRTAVDTSIKATEGIVTVTDTLTDEAQIDIEKTQAEATAPPKPFVIEEGRLKCAAIPGTAITTSQLIKAADEPESLDITLHTGGGITISRGYNRITLTKQERYRLKKVMIGE